jgi:hypothetical protein
MAEIVLSFAQHEKSRIAPMRDALRRVWLMWWDNDIGAGKPWAEAWARFVDMELARAKCVVAVWSAASVQSNPVHHCARVGQRASAYEERGLAEDLSRAEVDYLRSLQAVLPTPRLRSAWHVSAVPEGALRSF